MAQHSNYWSCSKFADWLRGANKLSHGTSAQWYTWDRAVKESHPFRFWLAEELLDNLQDFVTYPVRKVYDVKYYVNNRWITRTHSLTAHSRDIKPGQWCDVGNRFLPCLFNELVDFVEIETAWSHIAWGSKEDRAKYNPPFWATGWFRWRTWRCPQAGLDHLDWAMTLTVDDYFDDKTSEQVSEPTHQAITAKELKELYTWWTVDYPARKDPMDASGWTALCEERAASNPNGDIFSDGTKHTAEEKAHRRTVLDRCREIEKQYEDEDEIMMIRLIRIRDALWT